MLQVPCERSYCGDFVVFIDDYSHLAAINCIKSKDQVYNCFESYCKYMTNLAGKCIKKIWCDNGTEYLNKRFYNLARELDFRLRPPPAQTSIKWNS